MSRFSSLYHSSRSHRQSPPWSERRVLDDDRFRLAWYVDPASITREMPLGLTGTVLIVVAFGLRKVGLARDIRGPGSSKYSAAGPH